MLQANQVAALQGIREEYEQSTPAEEWPGAAACPMMLLCDVVYALGGDDREARQVLGAVTVDYLQAMTGGQP